jgi:hypothetical protein
VFAPLAVCSFAVTPPEVSEYNAEEVYTQTLAVYIAVVLASVIAVVHAEGTSNTIESGQLSDPTSRK